MRPDDYADATNNISTQEKLSKTRLSKKGKEFELNENQLYILALIAECDEASIDSLFRFYEIRFRDEHRVDIKNIANILQKNGLIRYTGNQTYVASDTGIERASKELKIRKNLAVRVDKKRIRD